jgi:hypothetical protein
VYSGELWAIELQLFELRVIAGLNFPIGKEALRRGS